MSKKYKIFMLLALLLPQIHYLPQFIGDGSLDASKLILWIVILVISYSVSNILLIILLEQHKQFYRKKTRFVAMLFLIYTSLMLFIFIVSLFTGLFYFLAYILLHFGLWLLLSYLLIYYIVSSFVVWDIAIISKNSLSVFEKMGLLMPLVAFGFGAHSDYFARSIFGSPLLFGQNVTTVDGSQYFSIVLLVISLVNPIITIKIGKEWLNNNLDVEV